MADDHDDERGPTRRKYVKCGGALIGGGLLAGCTGDSGSGGDGGSADAGGPTATADQTETPDPTETPDSTQTATKTATATETSTPTDTGYSVTMSPVGTVEFDAVPERSMVYSNHDADILVSLGQADAITSLGFPDNYSAVYYDELPGVSLDTDRLTKLYNDGVDKEVFYELDSDVHFYDPGMLINWFDWGEDDVEEISENVGPFVGNLIFRRSDGWHDYRYYTLYEAFEILADVFQERERFEAFRELHDEFIADIQSRLPPASERPNVMLTFEGTNEPETFSPYRLNDDGTSKKQWNDLGVSDALAGTGIENLSTENRGELDYENLLTVDPDVLLIRGHERKSAQEFRDTVLAYMEEHPVASELTAVQNGRVYRGGYLYQGPIHNLFLTERAAQQLYPEEFGDVTGDEQLFDRQRVADIVTGEFQDER